MFYQSGHAVGAQIVGFQPTLRSVAPGDPARKRQARHERRLQRNLSENWPAVAVKHLSQRSALIRFTGDRPAIETTAEEDLDDDPEDEAPDETEKKTGPDRGYFVDV